MSTSQISQTLFRFVSLRNPQLPDDNKINKRFVFRPTSFEGEDPELNFFDLAIDAGEEGIPKWNLLYNAAADFQNSDSYLGSLEAIQLLVGSSGIYDFSKWLARNRNFFTKTDLSDNVQGDVLDDETLMQLWNNLFYQVVTQKSFYLKETIIQLILANHFLDNYDAEGSDEAYETNKTIASSKVILPKKLFVDDMEDNSPIETEYSVQIIPISTRMKQRQAVSKAENENSRLAILKKNIERIEESYLKEYQQAYATAWQAHEEDIKEKWDQYNEEKDEALKEWCSERDPSITNPDDPCNQPPVFPLPELPKFVFSFEKTETEYLKERINDDNIDLVNYTDDADYFGPDVEVVLPGEKAINAKSFQKVQKNIDKAVAKNRDIIVNNTVNEGLTVVSIGGVPVNVSQRPAPPIGDPGTPQPPPTSSTDFPFVLYPGLHFPGNYLHFDLQLTVPDSSWQYSSIEYTHLNPSTGPFESNAVDSRELNTIYLSGLFQANNSLPLDGNHMLDPSITQITGYIYFTNGAVKSFIVPLREDENYKNLVAAGKGFGGKLNTATSPYSNEPEPPTNPPDGPGAENPPAGDTAPVVFKPSGFGVKQLGIADYRKVEQTVHCYVEGEVAHIENIMAREYREKSTRRLRRSETTTTTSSESEREQLTDTTSTDRFEMQNEVAKVLQESKDFSVNTSFSFDAFNAKFDTSAGFASHNSKEESVRNAVTHAKDITERAMDRVVSRVKQERVEKILEEFEENNKHGFDNTRGDKHVVGVYRWVDKIYKNQVYNYGKRLMFEFMIPEPGRLHALGMIDIKDTSVKIITQPVDPRTASSMKIATDTDLNEDNAKYWSSVYNVEVENKPALNITVSKSFSFSFPGDVGDEWDESAANNADIEFPFGYSSVKSTATWNHPDEGNIGFRATIGTQNLGPENNGNSFTDERVAGFVNSFPVSFSSVGYHAGNINFKVELALTAEGVAKWKKETFNAIIAGYEKALVKFEEQKQVEEELAQTVKTTNPGFYRQIENTVLRKNCISYLIDQKATAPLTYGKPMYKSGTENSFLNYEINVTRSLNDYTAFAKFLEQAFEWDIISYYLYPYYWGSRANWQQLYQYDNTDQLFRSFMQSGLARVVVTVRPGFEDAVRFYMQTGLIWNGGEVPLIDDPLHLAIVDELRAPTGEPEGKAWASRVPTSLTILQANSIGLVVDKALPCNCADVTADTWENHDKVPCGDSFVLTTNSLNEESNGLNLVEFGLMGIVSYQTVEDMDNGNYFPAEFTCMGETITVERDAAWNSADDISVVFEKLAAQLSFIPGVEASWFAGANNDLSGIAFIIDKSLIPVFTFTKHITIPSYDILKVFITSTSLKFASPTYQQKLQDKYGGILLEAEIGVALPIERFR